MKRNIKEVSQHVGKDDTGKKTETVGMRSKSNA